MDYTKHKIDDSVENIKVSKKDKEYVDGKIVKI